MHIRYLFMLAFVAALGGNALATDYFEVEGNDTKATANGVTGLLNGDRLIGNSLSAAGVGLDYWRVSTAVTALGIYRHRLTLTTTGTAGHVGSLRGLNQVAATAGPWPGPVGTAGVTDSTIQTSNTTTTPARFNQWYGFGKGESMYYRANGTSTTTADYAAEYSMIPVTPINIGTYNQGSISITTMGQGHSSDTDLWIYDSNLNAIAGYGNDDNSINGGGTGSGLQSLLTRTYGQGRYYMALSTFQMVNNMGSPCDDNFRTGILNDFGDSVANSSTTLNVNVAFAVTHSGGTSQFAATRVGAYDVNFYTFNVVPEPATMAVLGLGIVPFLRRRKK